MPEDRGGPGAAEDREAGPESVARTICLRELTRAPRSRAQLAGLLDRRGVPAAAATAVLDRLGEVGLIDDAADARSWVQSRHAGRGLARRALAEELRRRGIADEVAEDALGQLDAQDELARARALLARRLPSTRAVPVPARVRRLTGLLIRRGYPPGVALRAVMAAIETEDPIGDDLAAALGAEPPGP